LEDQSNYYSKYNWARLLNVYKRYLDNWSHEHVRSNKVEMKLSFMPVIFNISPTGSTNGELSKRSMVFKQAMSRTLKELEEKGMVHLSATKDKRSNKINLTEDGKEFVTNAQTQLKSLIETYVSLVGEEKFNTTIEVLTKIVEFHEKQNED
jgi:DNA-binding MarR family transcriptional regulator